MKTHFNLPRLLIFALVLSAITFSSCRKKEEKIETEDTEQSTSNDNNTAESIALDIDAIGSEVSENATQFAYKGNGIEGEAKEYGITAAPCATLIGIGTQIVTVDFGTTGCTGPDGRTRTGKLIYDFSASSPSTATFYRNPGFSMNVSSLNYVVDNYSVSIINKKVTNTTPSTIPAGINPGTNLTWSITANIAISKPSSSVTISWQCLRTKELLNTSDTLCYRGQNRFIRWSRAIVKLNGSASGVNARAENYVAVANNLIRDFNCSPDPLRPNKHPFIGGTLSYTPGTRATRLINYGNGSTCDLNATLTINNNTYNILLN